MAKKFVRGVTGIEDIESYDKTLTNVNDILSDGQDTYVHTKKGKTESYYKLTDSVKQVKSSDSMLTISKDDGTVSISNNGLATKEELSVKQDNLTVGDGLNLKNNNINLQPKLYLNGDGNLNNMIIGNFTGENLTNSPATGWFLYENFNFTLNNRNYVLQRATRYKLSGVVNNEVYLRTMDNATWSSWVKQVTDENILSTKQNTLASNASVAVFSNSLRQLYALKQTYTHANGLLKTHVKSISQNTDINTPQEEFNFTVKINQNAANIVVTLNDHDKTAFGKIMTAYGSNNTVRISGCVFTLSGSTLTVTTTSNTNQNYVISFSDILS